LPHAILLRIACWLPGMDVSALEHARRVLWWPPDEEVALWRYCLARDYPSAPLAVTSKFFHGSHDFRSQYASFCTACLNVTKYGHHFRQTRHCRVRPQQVLGLSVLLNIQGQAFVVVRVTPSSRRPSLYGSWPLIGIIEDCERANKYINQDRGGGMAFDLVEDQLLWSICILDNWVWCGGWFIHCPFAERCSFSASTELGVHISSGKVAFFRRFEGMPEWTTTGIVADLGWLQPCSIQDTQGFNSRPCGSTGPQRGPHNAIARPVVIGGEDGDAWVEFLGVLPCPPFPPEPRNDVLSSTDWQA